MQTFIEASVQGLLIGSTYAVIAFGLTLLYSVSGVLNFAHGNFVVLAMYLSLIAHQVLGLDPYVSSVIVVPIMFLVGVALYFAIFKHLAGAHILTIIQLTLGLLFILQSGLLMTQGGQYQRVPSMVDGKSLSLGLVHIQLSSAIAFVVSILLAIILYLALTRTSYGRSVRAVYQNPRGAQLVGIDIGRVRWMTFGSGFGLAALAAVLLVPGYPLHPSEGLNFTVIAILAFFLGGMGNYLGTFVGSILIGLSQSFGTIYLPAAYGFSLPFVIVVLAIIFRPRGLLTRNSK